MSKRKRSARKVRRAPQPAAVPDLRQQGLRAFRAGHYDQAIAVWADLAQDDAHVAAALAEAYARRARTRAVGTDQLADLERAIALAPQELCYQYYRGLALHRAGDLPAAIQAYRMVLERDAGWPGAGLVLALAVLEQDAQTELAAVPGSTPAIRATLAPVQVLLRGDTPAPTDNTAQGQLWRGLGQIRAGDGTALATLDDTRVLPSARITAIRRYYKGVAAAQRGDVVAALEEWQRVYHDEARRQTPRLQPWLLANLAAALIQCLSTQLDADDLDAAVATAQHALQLPLGNADLGALLVQALDRAAHATAAEGNWSRAAMLWEDARKVVSAHARLGSPRSLLHNLALAYEAQERWPQAAEAWRAMLRTRPRAQAGRPGNDDTDERDLGVPTAAQWAWVRQRVIECYKRAGQPGEAVAIFRQAIKAEPSNPELRLQLVDALLANEQEQAALNELQRILQLDPQHIDARLRLSAVHSARGEWYAAEQVLRDVLAQQPQHQDVRRQMARLLLARGQQHYSIGFADSAAKAFTEGQQFAPDDYQFPLSLAQIALDRDKVEQARALLERALALADDQPEVYMAVIECWALAGKLDEAHAVLARAEDALTLTPEFYVSLGALLLRHCTPPVFLNPFASALQRHEPVAPPWSRLATEMLDRAVTLRPDDPRLRFLIAGELITVRTDMALQYAEAGVQMLPDDIHGLALLGLLQGLNERKREARKTLQRAAQLARRQGNTELLRHIEETRRQIDNPLLHLAFQMGPFLDELEDDGLDIDDLFP